MRLLLSFLLVSVNVLADEQCKNAAKLIQEGVKIGDASDGEIGKYKEAAELCPTMPEAFYNLGVVLGSKGDHQGAFEQFKKAISIKRAGVYLIGAGRAALEIGVDAVPFFEEAAQFENVSASAYEGLALAYEKSGDISKAIEVLDKSSSPGSASAKYNKAILLLRAERREEAKKALTELLDRDPNHVLANFQLGLIIWGEGSQLDLGLDKVSQAARLAPKNAEIQRVFGGMLKELGDLERAELALRRALIAEPDDIESRVLLGLVLIDKKQESLAVEVLSQAVSQSPEHSNAHAALARAQVELGSYEAAESSFKKAIDLDPNNVGAVNDLGVLYKRQGYPDKAAEQFRAALALDPKLSVAQKNLED